MYHPLSPGVVPKGYTYIKEVLKREHKREDDICKMTYKPTKQKNYIMYAH